MIKNKIFASDVSAPSFLNNHRTGHWSWDVTPLINEIQTEFGFKASFINAIEDSFELSGEFLRFDEYETAIDPEKAKINRYYMDPTASDRVRYFTHSYWFDFKSGVELERIPTASELEAMYLKSNGAVQALPLVFELQLIIHEKHSVETDEQIEAFLFWRHF